MKTSRKNLIKLILISVLIFCGIIVFITSISPKDKFAQAKQDKEITIAQVDDLYYNGENYLSSKYTKKELLKVFSFSIDGEKVEIPQENIIIYSAKTATNPGKYYCDFTIQYEGDTYSASDIPFTIKKRKVTVTVLLNGKTDLSISEEERPSLAVSYDYTGAIDDDTELKTENGVTVHSLSYSNGAIQNYAYVENIPKTCGENYAIVACNARSDYYEFIYAKSTLTITRTNIPQLIYKSGETILVAATGNFGTVNSIDFSNIGTSANSSEYVALKTKIDERYDANDKLITENDFIACYSISVKGLDGIDESNVSAQLRVYLESGLRNKSEYNVIALYNNGDTDILKAKIADDGYLIFDVADMGNFVLITPIEGISATRYVYIAIISVAVVLVIIILIALFRRKY